MKIHLETFAFMDKDNAIISHTITDKQYDLFLALDTSSPDRLGEAQKNFFRAKMTMCRSSYQ